MDHLARAHAAVSVFSSSSHVRQGLFLLMALLTTLLVVQQFHHWTQPQEPLVHTLHSTGLARMSNVSATSSDVSRFARPPVAEQAMDQAARPSAPHWVF